MYDLFMSALKRMKAGEPAVLSTILHTEGPVPRVAGTQMAVFSDGTSVGTIGGGTSEQEAVRMAMECFRTGRSALGRFGTVNGTPSKDLPGGKILVHFLYLSPDTIRDRIYLEEAASLCVSDAGGWMVLRIRPDGNTETALYNGEAVSFSANVRAEQIRQFLWDRPVFEEGDPAWFVMPVIKKSRVYLFGAGHVAGKLAGILSVLGRDVTVLDDREELCNQEHFPEAVCLPLSPEKGFQQITVSGEDEIIAMARSHEIDYVTVKNALKTDARYIGCIGSMQKINKIRSRLLEDGFGEEDLNRLHAPIGLRIGAETPAEIAVSIAAEMIQCRKEVGKPQDF